MKKLKNTKKENKILKINYKKVAISSGIAISSLLLYLTEAKTESINRTLGSNYMESQLETEDPGYFWQETYTEIYNNLDIKDFDEEFIRIYNETQYIIIDGVEYPISHIQVKKINRF